MGCEMPLVFLQTIIAIKDGLPLVNKIVRFNRSVALVDSSDIEGRVYPNNIGRINGMVEELCNDENTTHTCTDDGVFPWHVFLVPTRESGKPRSFQMFKQALNVRNIFLS